MEGKQQRQHRHGYDHHQELERQAHLHEVTVGGVAVTYDPVELQYDSDGNLIKVIDPLAEETDMTYTADGLVASVTNRQGDSELGV